jgi:hypothetical protein
LSFIKSPKNRNKFTRELANFRDFDQRFSTSVTWKVDPSLSLWGKHLQGIENVSRLLHSKGAGKTCWVISGNSKMDGREMDLEAALENVVGSDWGTILSCIPGKLAYFKGEYDSLLLAK